MPDKIFNAEKGIYQSGPTKLIGNLYWDNWRLRIMMDEPECWLYDYYDEWKEYVRTDNWTKELNEAEKKWKRKDRMYKSLPIINTVLATLPFQLILIPMKIMVITW